MPFKLLTTIQSYTDIFDIVELFSLEKDVRILLAGYSLMSNLVTQKLTLFIVKYGCCEMFTLSNENLFIRSPHIFPFQGLKPNAKTNQYFCAA